MEIEKKLKDELEKVLGEEEVRIVTDCYNLINKNNPTILAEIKTHLTLLDRSQSQLSVIYYLINRMISQRYSEVREEHDRQYVTLVKRGRPSKDAIEAEIRAVCPEYAVAVLKIEDLEELREFVNMLLKCIDSNRRTVTEVLRTLGRVD